LIFVSIMDKSRNWASAHFLIVTVVINSKTGPVLSRFILIEVSPGASAFLFIFGTRISR